MSARLHGRITQWFDDRGYGFITASGGNKQVFLHISALAMRDVRPKIGDTVTFLLNRDEQGRMRALAVQFVGRETSASTAGMGAVRVPFLAIATVAGLAYMRRVPWWIVGLYAGASVLAWLLYGWDKSRAEEGGRRVPEDTLHLVALAGGWPGALVAQAQFRHKTKKASFRAVFWCTVLLNVAALGWLALGGRVPFG